MRNPLDEESTAVPSVGRRQLVLVDGRTFAISDEAGQMDGGAHGMVHADFRHLCEFHLRLRGTTSEVLASSTTSPLSAVIVARHAHKDNPSVKALLTRRRWIAHGLRDDVRIANPSARVEDWTAVLTVSADFAHLFDVKAGLAGTRQPVVAEDGGWRIDADGLGTSTRLRFDPAPDAFDAARSQFVWSMTVPPHGDVTISVTAEPIVDGTPAGLAFPLGLIPTDATPLRLLRTWRESAPRVRSTDSRVSPIVDQALSDIAALRIIDAGHPDRVAVAAGAPWFMTLFGRDSLLTSWMTLPFDPRLTAGVLGSLADLQGVTSDPIAEEQPGKILHELRQHGGGGPFATRRRYYGTVDATPLFLMVAAEAARWGALAPAELEGLAPALDAAVEWIVRYGDSNDDGFVDYQRSHSSGLSNQGWKDSWDGVNFADGSLPTGPIALAEVQGYTYAALLGAAELADEIPLSRGPDELIERAGMLRHSFNRKFWDERGWFVVALDGRGQRVDALTTNPGHALWTGIADDELAQQYLDRFCEPAMWTGWGLRTLADTMGAYDPLSYHNGSVWPHDTALCAAGAARYRRWDIVDQIVDGTLNAAGEFDGRPPELFAGIALSDVPMPVAYPASCSPQAWSSASILLLIRTMLGLAPSTDRSHLVVGREDLTNVPDLRIERLAFGGRTVTLDVVNGRARVS